MVEDQVDELGQRVGGPRALFGGDSLERQGGVGGRSQRHKPLGLPLELDQEHDPPALVVSADQNHVGMADVVVSSC